MIRILKKIINKLISIIAILCIIICLITQLCIIVIAIVLSISSYFGGYPFFLFLLLGATLIVFLIFLLKIFF